MDIDSGIKHLIIKVIRDQLQHACVDEIPETDSSRADVVVVRNMILTGRERIVLLVKHFDPIRKEAGGDASMLGAGAGPYVFKGWPDRLIGNYLFETIQGVVEMRCDFTRSRETADEADRLAQLVLGRAKAILRNGTGIRGLKDEFGERCMDFVVTGATEYDSGANTSNTSRFFLRWAALTLTSPGT